MAQMYDSPIETIHETGVRQEINELADLLDSRFRLPFGWKIGWDGIVGLVPGIGDFATNLVSLYIVYKAAILGCPQSVLLRMGLNILIDNVLDTIPLLGNLFDFIWKSNQRNLSLLDQYLANPHRTAAASKTLIFSVILILFFMILGIIVLTFFVARWFWGLFQAAW